MITGRTTEADTDTGDETETEEVAVSPFKGLDKPVVVFVSDPGVALGEFEKLETTVFKNEKIGLAMKAFHAVRMSPEDADADPILAGRGKGVPRMLVVDPVKERVKVLEERKIKTSTLFKAMAAVAKNFYEEKVDKIVKAHLKLLNERDKLHNEQKNLQTKEERLAEKGDKAKNEIKKVRKELTELKTEIEGLAKKERELWKLTPKAAHA